MNAKAFGLLIAFFVVFGFIGGFSLLETPKTLKTPLKTGQKAFKAAQTGQHRRARVAACVVLLDGHVDAHKAYDTNRKNEIDAEAFVDSVGILKHAMHRQKTRFDVDFLAFVVHTPRMQAMRAKLELFGWTVRNDDVPVKFDDVEEGYYKSELNKSGCCGMDELLKLNVFRLEEYDRVSVIDADVLVVQSLDEIWGAPDWIELIYTRGQMVAEPFQGGLWTVKPTRKTLDHMLDLVRRGAWYPGSGWEKSGLGWVYGGPTVQGIMPYYYTKVAPINASLPVSVCHYNNMGETEMCAGTPVEQVRAVHFTGRCPKPFRCHEAPGPVCKAVTERWWEESRSLEKKLGLPPRPRCPHGHYIPIGTAEQQKDVMEVLGIPL